jgi:hypothetical protein
MINDYSNEVSQRKLSKTFRRKNSENTLHNKDSANRSNFDSKTARLYDDNISDMNNSNKNNLGTTSLKHRNSINGKKNQNEVEEESDQVLSKEEEQVLNSEIKFWNEKLKNIREQRIESEKNREYLVKSLKQVHNKLTLRRKEARDLWKKKYFAEKKKAPEMEEKVANNLKEIEAINTKLFTSLDSDLRNMNHDSNSEAKVKTVMTINLRIV